MFTFAGGVLVAAAVAVTQLNPPSASDPGWLYVLVGLGSAGMVLLGQMVLRRQQKDKLIAEASEEVAAGAKIILDEYRKMLMESRAEISDLRERIAKLEDQLAQAKLARQGIERERLKAVHELARVQERVSHLEAQIRALETAMKSDE